jgi:hypothetical protein
MAFLHTNGEMEQAANCGEKEARQLPGRDRRAKCPASLVFAYSSGYQEKYGI